MKNSLLSPYICILNSYYFLKNMIKIDEQQVEVILVNENDEEIGTIEKIEAHQKGLLHRAFSIFIFNNNNELLIHQRASNKYHGGDLWTNTCCSHPLPNEEIAEAANRRLKEEMGITCELNQVGHLLYKVEVENNLIEHEYDHILLGKSDENPNPNAEEVKDWKWITIKDLENQIALHPENFTYWFKMILPKLNTYFQD